MVFCSREDGHPAETKAIPSLRTIHEDCLQTNCKNKSTVNVPASLICLELARSIADLDSMREGQSQVVSNLAEKSMPQLTLRRCSRAYRSAMVRRWQGDVGGDDLDEG